MSEKELLFTFKNELFQFCKQNIEDKIVKINQYILSLEQSRDADGKSTVGDKYETNRAMMQIEIEKAHTQLINANQLKLTLAQLETKKNKESASNGALLKTSEGFFLIGVGLGKVTFKEITLLCISLEAPFTKIILHKKKGDSFFFNQKQGYIEEIV